MPGHNRAKGGAERSVTPVCASMIAVAHSLSMTRDNTRSDCNTAIWLSTKLIAALAS